MRSRPTRVSRTMPASPRACRCFVTACRVTPAPSLSRAIDSGPSSDRRATILRRVASASAVKTGPASAAFTARALRRGDMAFDVRRLCRPPTVVHPERLVAPRRWNPIEARLGNRQHRAAVGLVQPELDERRRLLRIVPGGIDGVWMPPVREVCFRLDPFDEQLKGEMLVAG